MKRFTQCEKCGRCVPVLDTGLCKDCQIAIWDAARPDAPRKPPRPVHINSGLKVCEKCGIRAAAVRSMCTICYKRAQYAALSPEQRDAKRAAKRVANERRKAAKLAAKAMEV